MPGNDSVFKLTAKLPQQLLFFMKMVSSFAVNFSQQCIVAPLTLYSGWCRDCWHSFCQNNKLRYAVALRPLVLKESIQWVELLCMAGKRGTIPPYLPRRQLVQRCSIQHSVLLQVGVIATTRWLFN